MRHTRHWSDGECLGSGEGKAGRAMLDTCSNTRAAQQQGRSAQKRVWRPMKCAASKPHSGTPLFPTSIRSPPSFARLPTLVSIAGIQAVVASSFSFERQGGDSKRFEHEWYLRNAHFRHPCEFTTTFFLGWHLLKRRVGFKTAMVWTCGGASSEILGKASGLNQYQGR